MTTFVEFNPPAYTPFVFQPTLDGAQYTAVINWNLFGKRWYLNLYTIQGVLLICMPMVGSPVSSPVPGVSPDINLLKGYFAVSTMVWRPQNNQIEIGP